MSPDSPGDIFVTLDSDSIHQPSKQFADIGSGRRTGRAKTDVISGVSGSRSESPMAISRLLNADQHTFTYHLYHHYDAEPSLNQPRDTTSTRGNAASCIFTCL